MSFLRKSIDSSAIRIAAVCGNEVSIFDKIVGDRRKLLRVRKFSNHGQALNFADQFEETQKQVAAYGG